MITHNMIGQRFHKLVVKSQAPSRKNRRYWLCACDCGNSTIVDTASLNNGNTKSCGCWNRESASNRARKQSFKHGHSGGVASKSRASLTYRSWQAMLTRCTNPKATQYYNYGGRGITVCDRWQGPDGFANFLADVGERKEGTTLDRIDANKNYELGNVRWSTPQVQVSNRRPYKALSNFSDKEIAEEFYKRELDKRDESAFTPPIACVN